MSFDYNRQLIIKLGEDDTIRDVASALAGKHRSSVVNQEVAPRNPGIRRFPSNILQLPGSPVGMTDWHRALLAAQLKLLTENSRIYITGHGNRETIEEWPPKDLAEALQLSGLKKVKTISFVSCELAGRLPDTDNQDKMHEFHETPTWALTFARWLLGTYKVEAQIYARCFPVRAVPNLQEHLEAEEQADGSYPEPAEPPKPPITGKATSFAFAVKKEPMPRIDANGENRGYQGTGKWGVKNEAGAFVHRPELGPQHKRPLSKISYRITGEGYIIREFVEYKKNAANEYRYIGGSKVDRGD